MANQFGIPQEVEHRLRQKFALCAYCRREMKEYAGVRGCPSDKATIEHLNRYGPFYWSDGLKEEDLVICCGSCNSSRGQKSLAAWFASSYCVQRRITASTIAEEVKQYLKRLLSADNTGVGQAAAELEKGDIQDQSRHSRRCGPGKAGKKLVRYETAPEAVEKLAADAAAALANPQVGIHGVSAFYRNPVPSSAEFSAVAQHFKIYKTLGKGHYTIELPNPVTQEVADLFNRVFGRIP